MCIIICVEDGHFPTKATLKSAESLNSDGGAIAWLNKDGTMSYKKGIKASKISKIIKNQLTPNHVKTAIIHFRIASVGGVKPQLCHPFEITNEVSLNMGKGKTTTELLFHNGTWSDYADTLLDYLKVQKTPVQIPKGDYSDSRIMAYLAFQLGHQELNKLVSGWNKIAILTSEGIVKYGTGWVNHKGNSCSNDYAWKESVYSWNQSSWSNSRFADDCVTVSVSDYDTPEDKRVIDTLKTKYKMNMDDIEDQLSYGYTLEDILYEKEVNTVWDKDDQEARCRSLD